MPSFKKAEALTSCLSHHASLNRTRDVLDVHEVTSVSLSCPPCLRRFPACALRALLAPAAGPAAVGSAIAAGLVEPRGREARAQTRRERSGPGARQRASRKSETVVYSASSTKRKSKEEQRRLLIEVGESQKDSTWLLGLELKSAVQHLRSEHQPGSTCHCRIGLRSLSQTCSLASLNYPSAPSTHIGQACELHQGPLCILLVVVLHLKESTPTRGPSWRRSTVSHPATPIPGGRT